MLLYNIAVYYVYFRVNYKVRNGISIHYLYLFFLICSSTFREKQSLVPSIPNVLGLSLSNRISLVFVTKGHGHDLLGQISVTFLVY